MGRRENVEVFEDTKKLYSSNPLLKDAVQDASQKQELYLECTAVDGNIVQRDKSARVVVSKRERWKPQVHMLARKSVFSTLHRLRIRVEAWLKDLPHRKRQYADAPHCILVWIRQKCGMTFTGHTVKSRIRCTTMIAFIRRA